MTLLKSIKGAPASILWALAFHGKPMGRNHLVFATGYQRDTVTKGLQNLKALGLIEYGGRSQGWNLTSLIDQYELPGLFLGDSSEKGEVDEDIFEVCDEEADCTFSWLFDDKVEANKSPSRKVHSFRKADSSPLAQSGPKDKANKSPQESGDPLQEAKESPQDAQTTGCEAKKSPLAVNSVNAVVKPSPTDLKDLDQVKGISTTTTDLTEGVDPRLLRAFRSAGLVLNPRTRSLALLPHITPDYVHAHYAKLKADGKASRTGLLITILESGIPAPETNPNGHTATCTCDMCHRHYHYHLS